MRRNPERLAWTVLLAAFATFCVVATGFPLLLRSYLLNARQPLNAQVNAQRGTVRVERPGSSRPDATSLGDSFPLDLYKGDSVRTGELDQGLLTFFRGDEENRETLASVVLYDNSDLVLADAYSPRFGVSSGSHKAVLNVRGGRVRIEVQPSSDEWPVGVEVRTDHARVHLDAGSYALDITNQQTTTTVRRGTARVRVDNRELTLTDEQRAAVSLDGQLDGPLSAERNLVINGDFSQGIDVGWVVISDPPESTARIANASDEEGGAVVMFQHDQPEPAEIGLIQALNRNVKDLESLVLHVKVHLNYHSLSVCGSLGSECPVMVRIDYRDAAGSARQWVHGFYAFEDPSLQQPYYCTTCPEPSSGNHNQVREKTWFLYDSPNLMETLSADLQPAVIQSVRVYASGHSYESMVTDIELLAQE